MATWPNPQRLLAASYFEAAGNCILAAELRGAESARGDETLPGSLWSPALRSTLTPLFLATLARLYPFPQSLKPWEYKPLIVSDLHF